MYSLPAGWRERRHRHLDGVAPWAALGPSFGAAQGRLPPRVSKLRIGTWLGPLSRTPVGVRASTSKYGFISRNPTEREADLQLCSLQPVQKQLVEPGQTRDTDHTDDRAFGSKTPPFGLSRFPAYLATVFTYTLHPGSIEFKNTRGSRDTHVSHTDAPPVDTLSRKISTLAGVPSIQIHKREKLRVGHRLCSLALVSPEW